MPIHLTLNLPAITDAEFARIDKAVMDHAYDIQNRMGRLFDERIYENEIANRLRADGFQVFTQIPLQVVHGSFSKTYYLDLIVNGMVYELKVVENLHHSHKARALHYAMLQGVRLVKLPSTSACLRPHPASSHAMDQSQSCPRRDHDTQQNRNVGSRMGAVEFSDLNF